MVSYNNSHIDNPITGYYASQNIQTIRDTIPENPKFVYIQRQLDTLEEPVAEQVRQIKHIVVPGVVAVSAISIGYVMVFSRELYVVLASLGLTTLGQKLDPAALLEYWEKEDKKHSVMDAGEKNIDSMFA